jgi:hypothetical protein
MPLIPITSKSHRSKWHRKHLPGCRSRNWPKIPSLCVPCKGALSQRVRIPSGELLLQPEALGAGQEVTNGLKHSEKRPFLRVSDPCGPQRAANVEQASKYRTWVPTHHNDGEGRCCGRSEQHMHPAGPPG